MTKTWRGGLAAAMLACACSAHGAVWINEIHYDNNGTDLGEAIELAGNAGSSLAGWSVQLYNGADGAVYATYALSGTIPASCGQFGVVAVSAPGMQNGSPDGVALVDAAGKLVQFLSYEGNFRGNSGPAKRVRSIDIGVGESGTEPAGQSLQLAGTGTAYANFVWTSPFTATFGACNADQTFPGMDEPPAVTATTPAGGAQNVAIDANVTIAFSEAVVVAANAVTIACSATGTHAYAISGTGASRTIDPGVDFAGLETCTVTVSADGVTDTDGTANTMLASHVFTFATQTVETGYYASVDTSSAQALRQSLHAVIDDHTRYPYTSTATDTWDILELADEDPSNPGRILDVYKNASYAKVGGGNTEFNREHTWPKSYGFTNDASTNYPYTDTHMLFLSDDGYNSSRNNKPYADCVSACSEYVTLENNGTGGGSGVFPGNSNWADTNYWQTWGDRKGDVARAVLYMDVRYEGGTHGVTGAAEPDLIVTDNAALINASGSNESVAYMGLLTILLQWHAQDPPDDKERLRNEVVYSFQGNRNPFIDHPEWAACLHQGQCQ